MNLVSLIIATVCLCIIAAMLVPVVQRQARNRAREKGRTESAGFSEEQPDSPRALFVVRPRIIARKEADEHAPLSHFFTASTPISA